MFSLLLLLFYLILLNRKYKFQAVKLSEKVFYTINQIGNLLNYAEIPFLQLSKKYA